MESHYCRSTSKKLFIEQTISAKADLYKEYTNYCRNEGRKAASTCYFMTLFEENNLSVFTPRKDRCDTCCGHEAGNITDENYQRNIQMKEQARNAKQKTKLCV